MSTNPSHRRFALPLALQLLAIVVGSLVVAQLVTLALTVIIPPEPSQRWNLDDVAKRLQGAEVSGFLDRRRMGGPPDISGSGWLVSTSSREALADKLNRSTQDVVLAFYTQLPVGGVTVPVAGDHSPQAAMDPAGTTFTWLIGTARAQGMPGGPPPGGMPGGAFPGGGIPGGGFPGGGMPGSGNPGAGIPRGGPPPQRAPSPTQSSPPQSSPAQSSPPPSSPQQAEPPAIPDGAGSASVQHAPGNGPGTSRAPGMAPGAPSAVALPPIAIGQQAFPSPALKPAPRPTAIGSQAAGPTAALPTQTPPPAAAPDPAAPSPQNVAVLGSAATTDASIAVVRGTPQPIPFRQNSGLFSFASPPFIEGDFIAAVRQADGSWIAVAPRPEPFPNRWQKRVMLWFVLSLLIVGPFAWLFARRIVKPLERFAQTAEMLGRDPAASVLPLSGPAEVGRAARAFNVMQTRLRAFVDDRTAMIGAISHDLRTPLTRLRFRLEDVPDDQRDALLGEVEEMEQMINQVISFIRDASTPGARERVDFAGLVENTVAKAKVLGGKVELERIEHGYVEVDPLGMRRVLGNLLENALKYGEHARVRVVLRDDQAVAEIIDDGPGIPAEEHEQAFEPFYRGAQARESDKPGSGLGLAVCRSIARAHGGEVSLEHRSDGFVASVALPLSFDDRLKKAA